MKTPSRISTVISILLLITLACTENIQYPLDSTYVRLVVDGAINTDTSVHRVRLKRSGDPLNEDPGSAISKANVTISDGNLTFNLKESESTPGLYETDSTVFGIPGNTYTLHISNVDVNNDGIMEEYSASSFIERINPIDSIQVKSESFGDAKGWLINLYGLEIGGGRNFYLMKAYKNGVLLTDSTYECNSFADNTGFEGKYYNGFSVYYLNYSKPDERLVSGDIVTLEMEGITEEYKNFLLGFITEYQPKIPLFSGPSANIPTNIQPSEKAVGFFTAYSCMRKSKVYKGE
jgi:hypothetical protein